MSYLPNPYIEENLAFSFQLEYQAAQYYPRSLPGIYLQVFAIICILSHGPLLLEAGAQTNTVEEVRNAMEPFADILNRVLKGSDKRRLKYDMIKNSMENMRSERFIREKFKGGLPE